MGTQTVLRLAAVIAMTAGALCAAKQPKPPSQPDMSEACVSVHDIRSSGRFGGQRLYALVVNGCRVTASVFLNIGYFDSRGNQYGDGIESMTLAAGSRREIYHYAPQTGLLGPDWTASRIIALHASSENGSDLNQTALGASRVPQEQQGRIRIKVAMAQDELTAFCLRILQTTMDLQSAPVQDYAAQEEARTVATLYECASVLKLLPLTP